MKITIPIIALLIGLFLLSCSREKELVAPASATKPFHCYNNTMDEDETSVDAGGSCMSNGATLTPNCCSADSAFIGPYKYKVTSSNLTVNGLGEKVYTINFTGGYIKVTTNSNVDYNYELWLTTSSPAHDECQCVIYTTNYGTYNLTLGDVIVKSNGSSTAIDICNGAIYPGGQPTSVKMFANVN